MSTAANRQYLAHIVALKQAVVASKPRAKTPVRRVNRMHGCLRVNS